VYYSEQLASLALSMLLTFKPIVFHFTLCIIFYSTGVDVS